MDEGSSNIDFKVLCSDLGNHPAHICCCCNKLNLTLCNNLSLLMGSYRVVQLQVTVIDTYAYILDSPLLHILSFCGCMAYS